MASLVVPVAIMVSRAVRSPAVMLDVVTRVGLPVTVVAIMMAVMMSVCVAVVVIRGAIVAGITGIAGINIASTSIAGAVITIITRVRGIRHAGGQSEGE